jgi:hypothetical protein
MFKLLTITCILANAAFAQQDPGISKALEGLPEEVRSQVVLTPSRDKSFTMDPADPITAAVHFATRMSGDEDLRNRSLHRVGQRAIHQGRHAIARELASTITDYRAALLLAELAGDIGKADPKRALEWWELAAGMTRLVKPWQAESIASRLVVSGHLMGLDQAKITPWFQSIREPHLHFTTGTEIVAINAVRSGSFDLSAYRAERESIKRDVPLPGLLEVARRLLDSAVASAKKPTCASLTRAALEVLRDSNVTHAELVVEAAFRLYQAGEHDLSKQTFAAIEKVLGGPPDEISRMHYYMSCLWQARGQGSTLFPLLESSEKQARALEQMYHPFAFSWLGAAWERLGERSKGEALTVAGAEAAKTNVNPRMRNLGAFEICLCHAVTSRSLPPNVAKLLHEIDGGN